MVPLFLILLVPPNSVGTLSLADPPPSQSEKCEGFLFSPICPQSYHPFSLSKNFEASVLSRAGVSCQFTAAVLERVLPFTCFI